MKKITVEEIMKLKPCYTEKKVESLIGSGKTPLEILDLEIPKNDKVWLLLRPEYISEKSIHLLACDFAQEVAYLNPDPRVQAAIDAKRMWVDGKITDEELEKAARAAVDAARVAWADARVAWAAWAAAEAARADASAARAAWADARAAAMAADAACAADAAMAADVDIETKQIERVRKVFIDMEELK